MNRDSNPSITAHEIISFCADNGLNHVGIDEAQLLIDFFDDNGHGALSRDEFSHIFLPCENHILREEVMRRNYYESEVRRGEFLNDDVEHAAVRVLSREF